MRSPAGRLALRRAVRPLLFCVLFAPPVLHCLTHAGAQSAAQIDGVARRARRYNPIIQEAARRHGVDARLLWVIAYLETRFNPGLVSRKGARGMMQFMPFTAARYGLTNPHDPAASVDAAAKNVRRLAARFGTRADLILAGYNAGEAAVTAYLTGSPVRAGGRVINPSGIITGGVPPYGETRAYVARGLRLLESTGLDYAPAPRITPVEDETTPRAPARQSIRPGADSDPRNNQRVPGRRSIYLSGGHDED